MHGAYNQPLKSGNYQGMKNLIFKFWIANVLIAFVLFVVYRLGISESESENDTFFKTLLYILDILLSLGYSLIYLIGMLICSLLLFLNLINKIRNNYYFSMLTFLLIPIAGIIYTVWIMLMIGNSSDNDSPDFVRIFLTFLVVYLISNLTQFLIFRKKITTNFPDSESRRNML
ncbi:hypothetical protein AXA65_04120 [Chryseobacterium sp. FP211-J200]|nr:hypothetical protein AXA65_04120 [Chryseobacterium sp. FP211-J200]